MTNQSDLDCLWVWLVIAVLAVLVYWLYFSRGPDRDREEAIILDPDDGEGGYDESVFIEAGMITEQRKSGRERGGAVILRYKKDPQDYSAQLNLNSYRGQRMVYRDESDS